MTGASGIERVRPTGVLSEWTTPATAALTGCEAGKSRMGRSAALGSASGGAGATTTAIGAESRGAGIPAMRIGAGVASVPS
jgi:hypothetical protein